MAGHRYSDLEISTGLDKAGCRATLRGDTTATKVQKDLTTPGFQGQVGSGGDSSSLIGECAVEEKAEIRELQPCSFISQSKSNGRELASCRGEPREEAGQGEANLAASLRSSVMFVNTGT